MERKCVNVFGRIILLLFGMSLWILENVNGQVKGNKYVTSFKMENIDAWWVKDDGTFDHCPAICDGDDGTYNETQYKAGKWCVVFELNDDRVRCGVNLIQMNQGGSSWQRAKSILVEQSSSMKSGYTEVCKLEKLQTDNKYLEVKLPVPIDQKYVRLTFEPNKKVNGGGDGTMILQEIRFCVGVSDWKITHKHAKWFELRDELSPEAKDLDTFEDSTKMFVDTSSGSVSKAIQASHVYIDTIYMHRGTTVRLSLPDKTTSRVSVPSYQRWYSYRRDANFTTGLTGNNEINDLLTPTVANKYYKLANGYVGAPLTFNSGDTPQVAAVGYALQEMDFYYPTQEEFERWFGNSAVDGNYFIVGCDVSRNNDFTETFSKDDSHKSSFWDEPHYEPTLSHRVLFYIVAVDGREDTPSQPAWETGGYGRLSREEYRDGGTKYLEEYEITYPSKRFSDYTKEMVALSKDARSYAIPGASAQKDTKELSLSLENNTAGISLVSEEVSGVDRVISFSYPEKKDNTGRQEVDDGSEATILVRKKVDGHTYNIARYRLRFERETSLLTQHIVDDLGDDGYEWKDEPWKDYQYRTPSYMDENYQLLTQLDWDYDEKVSGQYGNSGFYSFPMAWKYSSYAFYDGAPVEDVVLSLQDYNMPEWGFYAIMNNFIESQDYNWGQVINNHARLLEGSSYHMFIDASDRPGVVAQLPFKQNLCVGAELFVSAWVKSAGYNSTSYDAGMMFTVMGVDENGGMTPLYRHATGQIRRTDYIGHRMPGCGTGTNDWLQVYFSFINNSDVDFDHYVLQVDNYSASTEGADMYLDDVRVYLRTVNAEVTQQEATCVDERTRMNIKLGWEQILSRTGDVAIVEGDKWRALDFCIVDSVKFSEMLAGKENPTEEDVVAAIEAAKQPIGIGAEGQDYDYLRLYYNLNFERNKEYVDLKSAEATVEDEREGGSLVVNNPVDTGKREEAYGFYRLTEDGLQFLSVDFYSMLSPNRPYFLLVHVPLTGADGVEEGDPTSASFADCLDACAIKTFFSVTSETLLKMNGQIVDPATDFCAGQVFEFSVSLRVPVGSGGEDDYVNVSDNVYFDWFFGTEDELLAGQEKYGNTTLWDALKAFRALYPDAVAVDDATPPGEGSSVDHTVVHFTEDMFKLLTYYSSLHETGRNNRLVLHRENLDIQLLEDGLRLVVCPIPTLIPPSESGVSEDQWAYVCWGYIPLVLHTSGKAPGLHAGMGYWEYPTEDFNPGLRIGLEQIRSAVTAGNPLTVSLRSAEYTNENVDRVDKITTVDHRDYVFLVDTDDPDLKEFIPEDGTFTEFDLPVGWVDELEARHYGDGVTSFDNKMTMHFDLDGKLVEDTGSPSAGKFKFSPKEGYTYTLMVHFEEKLKEGAGNACFGQFPMEMKVVPEYLVWKGQPADNWNNDTYWERVTEASRLQKTDDAFLEGNKTPNGFVPMAFSKVVIPEGGKVELYKAGYETGKGWQSERPGHIGLPTPDIQYDLVAEEEKEGDGRPALVTKRFRVSLVGEIHFEPGAEMLHPEYLIYDKAYVDYRLRGGLWHELASPLRGVVAGDFYTGKGGREQGEYFSALHYDGTENSRFEPSVYQRGWQPSGAMLYRLGKDAANVAVAGNWSGLYNDVSVPYSPGTGFSLKVQDLPESTGGEAMFRLPKSDESYTYYNKGQEAGEQTVDVKEARTGAGRLATDVLYQRDPDYASAQEGEPIRVTPKVTADGKYYLVGNPFMAGLDMSEFFKENTGLQPKYWMTEAAGQEVAVGKDGNGWVSVGSAASLVAPVVPPLRAFFVEKKEDGGAASEIVFTAGMQAAFSSRDEASGSGARLYLSAVGADRRTGRAVVDFREDASEGYDAGEDALLFADAHLGDLPMVYTVGGQHALSVNTTRGRRLVPVGLSLEGDETVRLRFEGTAAQGGVDLYDARERTRRTIWDGMEVDVSEEDAGRYYLVRKGVEDDGKADGNEDVVFCTLRGGVVVVSSASGGLKAVNVYTVGGMKVAGKSLPDGSTSCRLSVRPGEVYVVEAVRDGRSAVRTKLGVE